MKNHVEYEKKERGEKIVETMILLTLHEIMSTCFEYNLKTFRSHLFFFILPPLSSIFLLFLSTFSMSFCFIILFKCIVRIFLLFYSLCETSSLFDCYLRNRAKWEDKERKTRKIYMKLFMHE